MKAINTTLFYFAMVTTVAAQQLEDQVEYELVNLGRKVNSIYHDTSPIISPDGKTLYFMVTNHPENNKGTDGSQDIWYAELDTLTGEWSDAIHMPSPLNKNRLNQVLSVSLNGNKLLVRGGNGKDELGFSISQKIGGAWQKPEPLDIPGFESMCKGRFNGAFLSYDEKALLMYFHERTDSKYSDLYVSFNQGNGKWSQPRKIASLNTHMDEFGPYLAPDNKTLYFASNRGGGYGSTDVYRTTRQDDTWLQWAEPENVGKPVNTKGFDAYYAVGIADTTIFTTRAHMSADGGHVDIYTFQKVIIKAPKLFLEGSVLNNNTLDPIQASVRVEQEGEVVEIAQSDLTTGMFKIPLSSEGKFILSAQAEGYLQAMDSVEIYNVTADTTVYKDLYLQPLEVGLSVRLNNIFFDYNKTTLRPESYPELNKVVEMLEQNPNLQIEIGGHTDSRGSDTYNAELSQGRADAVRAYLTKNWVEPERVSSLGYGESKPEVPNDSEENMQINRRVEFTILKNDFTLNTEE
jgi:OmpA-OmpF porin, OOP family